jgi:hypothetical protein
MAGEKTANGPEEDQIRAHDIIAGAAVEIAEDSLPDDHEREFESQDQENALDRFVMVIGAPSTLFTKMTPQKGWLAPIIFILLASLAHGIVTMNLTDLDGWYEQQLEQNYNKLPDWQKRQLDKRKDSAKRTSKKIQFFTMKASLFVWPWLKAATNLLFFASFLFITSALCKGRKSFTLCLAITAHALLIDAWRHLTMAVVAAGTGLVQVSTNMARLVEQEAAPTLYVVLKWIDPFSAAFFFLLAIGLIKSLKVKRPILAVSLLILILLAGLGLTVGFAFATSKAKSFFMKG